MSTIAPSDNPAAKALRQRFLNTLNQMHVPAQELAPTCTTGDMLYLSTDNSDSHAVYDNLFKSQIGGRLVVCDGPPAREKLSNTQVQNALKAFPGVVSVTVGREKPTITVTTQTKDQQSFMQSILANSIKADGLTETINVQARK